MQTLNRTIETVANTAIIIVAVLLSITLLKPYISNRQASRPEQSSHATTETLRIGANLAGTDVDFTKSRQTLVLAVSSTCHFCTESADFYKKLAQSKNSARLVAVLPQSVEDGRTYLDKLGIQVDEVKHISLDSMGVTGTPTLLLVDNNGVIKNLWLGKLPHEEEAEVFKAL